MYYANQTLYHKKTKELVALHPSENDSIWNWEIYKGRTRVITEKGEIKFVDISEYTNFVDYFGRPASHTKVKPKNKYVDETLKIYLIDEKEKEKKKVEICEDWKNENLKFLGKKTSTLVKVKNDGPGTTYQYRELHKYSSFFADGSKCLEFYNWFIKEMNAKPLCYKKDRFSEKFIASNHFFKFKNKYWLCDFYLNEITEIKFNL